MRYFLTCFIAAGSVAAAAESITDGPYVFHREKSAQAIWVCEGAVKPVALPVGAKLAAPCGDVGGFALDNSNPVAPDMLPQPKRWAAVSDIHGQAAAFLTLLRAQQVIGAANQWTFGDGVLVINGDVFDRGPQQTEALWAIYRLGQEAKAAGGSVQMLLGNHENMVLRGDLRYQPPKYLAVAKLLFRSVPELYGADTELGRWLRTRATVLKLGDTLFVHGGISPDLPRLAPELTALNAKVRAHLADKREDYQHDPQATWLFATNGPLWYRGYFRLPRASSAEIDALLKQFEVKRIVVGHTTRDEIVSLYGGRVIGIDAALKDGAPGELLIRENNRLLRGLADGSRKLLAPGDDDGTANQLLPDAEDRAAAAKAEQAAKGNASRR
jgi:hypothetical protein